MTGGRDDLDDVIGRLVIEGSRTAAHAEVVAVASRDAARARAFADELGLEASFGSYEELLASGVKIDRIGGCSMGAFHAVNMGLKRPDLFPVAIGLSGNYDPTSWHGWGEMGEATYFANPCAYVPGMGGDHLQWVRAHANILLVVGQGAFEVHPTKSLPGAHQLADLLAQKNIPHELDLWGHDSAHDWPWWRKQLAHHLPRFC